MSKVPTLFQTLLGGVAQSLMMELDVRSDWDHNIVPLCIYKTIFNIFNILYRDIF